MNKAPDGTHDGSGELRVQPTLPPRARRLLRLAPLAAVPPAVFLVLQGAPLADVILLPTVLGALPVMAVAQAMVLDQVEIERLPAYASTIVSILVLAGLCGAAGVAGWGAAALGLVGMAWGPFLGWTLLLTAVALGLMTLFRLLAPRLGMREYPVVRRLLPETPGEKALFVGVSFAAGIGEELVFRGYALAVLTPYVGLAAAVAISTLSFGVVHAYQGVLGFVRTSALGALLAWGYLASGSLLPAMAAHALLDILAGIVLAERLMVPEPPSGV